MLSITLYSSRETTVLRRQKNCKDVNVIRLLVKQDLAPPFPNAEIAPRLYLGLLLCVTAVDSAHCSQMKQMKYKINCPRQWDRRRSTVGQKTLDSGTEDARQWDRRRSTVGQKKMNFLSLM